MSALTVIPAIFKDPDRALEALVGAKRSLDQAKDAVRSRERTNDRMFEEASGQMHPRQLQVAKECKSLLEPLVVAAERARSDFDVAFAVYQEAARARDAQAANDLAKSNAGITRVMTIAIWVQAAIALFAVLATVLRWSK